MAEARRSEGRERLLTVILILVLAVGLVVVVVWHDWATHGPQTRPWRLQSLVTDGRTMTVWMDEFNCGDHIYPPIISESAGSVTVIIQASDGEEGMGCHGGAVRVTFHLPHRLGSRILGGCQLNDCSHQYPTPPVGLEL